MKNYIKHITILLVFVCGLFTANAQNTKAEKKAAKLSDIKNLVNSQRFVFVANYVLPLGGGGRALTSQYDLTITKDSVSAFLPYFGRAYMADFGSIDGGIKFTSTHFTYKLTGKKSRWEILITFTDANIINGPKGVRQMRLNVSEDGYGSLQITSSNRDAISFNGYIEEIGKK
ncbi:MAG: DUF4251 domain-containing protein [Mucilaginibacter sp.]